LRTDALAALWRQRSPIPEVRYAKYEEELKEQQAAREERAQSVRDNLVSSLPTSGPSNTKPELAITELTSAGTRVEKAISTVNRNYRTKDDHLRTELDAHDHFGRFEPTTREAIADTFRRLAWLCFRQLWNNLSPQEQFLLYDLAYDGLVNPQNRHHLHNLLHKGLLRLDGHGRLRLASEAFRAFVFAKSRRPQALRYAPDDRWGAVRVPLVLLLVTGALFVALTQSVPLSQLQWVLALLVALLPQLNTLLKIPAPSAPPSAEQK
jgi:hypothetical protein